MAKLCKICGSKIMGDVLKREVIKALDERPEEQTYRGFVEFKCDTCSKVYKHGKVIYSRLAKFHLWFIR